MRSHPLVGLPADRRMIGPHPTQTVGEKYIRAVVDGAQCLPVLIPSLEPALDLRATLEPAGLLVTAAPPGGGESVRLAHREAAAGAQIGVTGVDWALAETGTLILVSGSGRPRSTSLLPDTHVAVFGKGHLLESLEQLGIMLEALHADPARSPSGAMISFITGPSRTADIELTLTRGVHGPKEVHAVFVEAL